MPHSKEKQEQFNEYNRNRYEVISARFLKKDNVRTIIQQAADKVGLNFNGFVKCAIQKAVNEVLADDERSFQEYAEEQKPLLQSARHQPKKKDSLLSQLLAAKNEQKNLQNENTKKVILSNKLDL